MGHLERSAKHPVKVGFSQIYIQVGVSFPFSATFQQALAAEFNSSVRPSAQFLKKYGDDWTIVFLISAKREIEATEVRGPGTLRRKKRQEWTIFLPFDLIQRQSEPNRAACMELFTSTATVLERVGVDTGALRPRFDALASDLLANPAHFHDHE